MLDRIESYIWDASVITIGSWSVLVTMTLVIWEDSLGFTDNFTFLNVDLIASAFWMFLIIVSLSLFCNSA